MLDDGKQDPDSRWIATGLGEITAGMRKWIRGQAVVNRELGNMEGYLRTHVFNRPIPTTEQKVLLLGLAKDDEQTGAYLTLLASRF